MTLDAKLADTQSPGDHTQQWSEELAQTVLLPTQTWQEPQYNARRYAKSGLWLGGIAGCTSLVLNIVGSTRWPAMSGELQHPLRIIQVYLTFPLGESALQLNSGVLLSLGCLLYLATGMLYGMLFELAISYFLPRAGVGMRLVFCSLLAILIWTLNFYGLLIWLQPLLFGGRWIIDFIPWWVAG